VIARNGIDTLAVGVKGITDRSFDDKAVLAQVKKIVLKEEGIREVSRLRARQIGQKNWIDIEAMFDPQMKVSEVKRIIERVKKNVKDNFERIGDVVIVSRVTKPELKEL